MKMLLLVLLAAVAGATAAGPPSLASTIREARWKKRVLLVLAPTATQADFQAQKQLLATNASGLQERDLLVLDVRYDQLSPADQQYFQQQMKLQLHGFAVLLIGKDGGVKLRSTQPLTPAALFATIDQMPMRQQEMRRGQ